MTLLDCGFESSNNHVTTLNPNQDRQSYKMVKPHKSLKETLARHDVNELLLLQQ